MDGFVWQGNLRGIYTAADGYKWLISKKHDITQTVSWLWVWKLKVPEKIKFLIWCACHNSLLVGSMLHHRHLAPTSSCARCMGGDESVMHCFRDCPKAKNLWEALGFTDINFYSVNDLQGWINLSINDPKCSLFFAALWWNWRARNIESIGHETVTQFYILAETKSLAIIIDKCFPTTSLNTTLSRWITWHPSKEDCMVLNVDGSCFGNPGRAGFGGLFRFGSGNWVLGFSGYLGVSTNTHAELMALYHGLKLANNFGYQQVICYSDSKMVIDLITQGCNSTHLYAPVVASIKDLLNLEWTISINHTLREGNFCADFLAKYGASNNDNLRLWDHPPEDLKTLLSTDSMRVPHLRV